MDAQRYVGGCGVDHNGERAQRGVVGPVEVVEHDQGRWGAGRQQRGPDPLGTTRTPAARGCRRVAARGQVHLDAQASAERQGHSVAPRRRGRAPRPRAHPDRGCRRRVVDQARLAEDPGRGPGTQRGPATRCPARPARARARHCRRLGRAAAGAFLAVSRSWSPAPAASPRAPRPAGDGILERPQASGAGIDPEVLGQHTAHVRRASSASAWRPARTSATAWTAHNRSRRLGEHPPPSRWRPGRWRAHRAPSRLRRRASSTIPGTCSDDARAATTSRWSGGRRTAPPATGQGRVDVGEDLDHLVPARRPGPATPRSTCEPRGASSRSTRAADSAEGMGVHVGPRPEHVAVVGGLDECRRGATAGRARAPAAARRGRSAGRRAQPAAPLPRPRSASRSADTARPGVSARAATIERGLAGAEVQALRARGEARVLPSTMEMHDGTVRVSLLGPSQAGRSVAQEAGSTVVT